MSDVFIWYYSKDRAIATELCRRLISERWTVFLDAQTRIGQRYDEVIEA